MSKLSSKLEKVGGFLIIVIAITGLSLISVFEPPTFIQIICAIAGSIVCLFGIVILFSEGPILPELQARKAAKKVANVK
jgi:hypothetical protein